MKIVIPLGVVTNGTFESNDGLTTYSSSFLDLRETQTVNADGYTEATFARFVMSAANIATVQAALYHLPLLLWNETGTDPTITVDLIVVAETIADVSTDRVYTLTEEADDASYDNDMWSIGPICTNCFWRSFETISIDTDAGTKTMRCRNCSYRTILTESSQAVQREKSKALV